MIAQVAELMKCGPGPQPKVRQGQPAGSADLSRMSCSIDAGSHFVSRNTIVPFAQTPHSVSVERPP